MKSGFDYKEFLEWSKSIGMVEKEFRKWLENFLLTAGYEAMQKARKRQQTYEYVNSKGEHKIGLIDTGTMLKMWYVSKITWKGNSLYVEIGNNAEYSSFIEFGQRSFQGTYILKISTDDIQRELPARFNKAWLLFLKEKGVV